MFHTIRWRPDRVIHIAERHQVTVEEVEEAVFEDPRRLFLRGPRSESRPDKYIYYLFGCTSDT
ncbi:MAG: hypothetical protein D9V47_07080 [Clostridia bacterium]|nr:MAG: hypothetical protein D9V47_07080 [Clostridia bacterium]